MTLASAAFAAARAMSHAARPASSGGGVGEAQRLARGGQPRFPACRWRPRAPLPPSIPVGAYVCAEAETVQRVRAALLDSGRLKPHGVTRFDARVWARAGRDGHLPIPTDPDAAEWAVHVFGLPPADPRTTPRRPHRLRRGPLRLRRSHRLPRVLRPPRRRARRPRPRPRPRSATGRHPPHPPVPSARFIPAATSAGSAAESALRVDAEARARPGGRVQPPKWAPPTTTPRSLASPSPSSSPASGGFGARSATSAAGGVRVRVVSPRETAVRRQSRVRRGDGRARGWTPGRRGYHGRVRGDHPAARRAHRRVPVPIVQRAGHARADWTIREARSTARYSGRSSRVVPERFCWKTSRGWRPWTTARCWTSSSRT